MMVVFAWASWNGATYYIDVFGRRMEKELNALRNEVQRMTRSPSLEGMSNIGSPVGSPAGPSGNDGSADATTTALDLGPPASQDQKEEVHSRSKESEQISAANGSATALGGAQHASKEDAKTK